MLDRISQGFRRIIPKSGTSTPFVSYVVIAYDMPQQAEITIRSLLPGYQRGVSASDYEVLIVENASPNTLTDAFLQTLPPNVSYHLRKETRPTPIHAINYGLERARGQHICVMIDGARLLTPGVVRNTILGHRVADNAIVTVPGYHLGKELQQNAVSSGYDMEHERRLMKSIAWPDNGYRLFEIACFSGSCKWGFFLSQSESNCISMSAKLWRRLGGFDARFEARGGGLVNLDTYKRALESPGTRHIVLPGEGSFHQFHGGATTGGEAEKDREALIDSIKDEYFSIRGEKYKAPETDPIYLGEFPREAQKFIHFSSDKILQRVQNSAKPHDDLASIIDN